MGKSLKSRDRFRIEVLNLSELVVWSAKFIASTLRLVQRESALAIILSITSQLSLIIAVFLPIKILFLLEGERVPRFFPPSLRDFDRDTLVLWMALLALLAFLVHVSTRSLFQSQLVRGSRKIISQSDKLPMFKKDEESVEQTFKQVTLIASSTIFAVLSLVFLALFYVEVFFGLIIFLFLILFVLLFSLAKNSGKREDSLEKIVNSQRVFSTIGFLVIFGLVLVDFLTGTGPNLIWALLSILLARQVLSRVPNVSRGLLRLFRKRFAVSAMVYRNFPKKPPPLTSASDLARWVSQGSWTSDVINLLSSVDGSRPWTSEDLTWMMTSTNQHLDFAATTPNGKPKFIVRVYSATNQLQASREKEVLLAGITDLPAPELVKAGMIQSLPCHVLNVSHLTHVASGWPNRKTLLLERLWEVSPTEDLVQRFNRSTGTLLSLISESTCRRAAEVSANLGITIKKSEIAHVVERKAQFDDLPLVLDSGAIALEHVWQGEDGRPVLMYWGNWSLQPMGLSVAKSSRHSSPPEGEIDFSAFLREGSRVPTSEELRELQALGALAKFLRNNDFVRATKSIAAISNRRFVDHEDISSELEHPDEEQLGD